jgi:anaerobic dimethyl sulfoxide reductase subunit A
MAREKGVPTIIIDPKYTWDAEVYADQWIPIKPGTDAALLMGMANVILKEGLYDKAWVDKWMVGFQQQSDYILGKGGKGVGDYDPQYTQYDTIDKTPEWAEKICGVPAETIRELARLYAKTKPANLARHCSSTRKSYGEYTLRLCTFLSVLTSNAPYVHGGSTGSYCGSRPWPKIMGALPGVLPGGGEIGLSTSSGGTAGGYGAPTFYRSYQWWKAVTYSDLARAGKMTWDQWATLVGFNAYPPLKSMFNPKMLWMGSNHAHGGNFLVMAENTNMQLKTLERMELIIQAHSKMIATARYADIVFPISDWALEIPFFSYSTYGGFGNMVYMSGPSKKIPGECKSIAQFYANVCERIGGMDLAKQWFKYYTGDQNWDQDWMTFLKDSWEKVTVPWLKSKGVANPASFDEVKAAKSGPVIMYRNEEYGDDTYCGQGVEITSKSGKVEIYNSILADPSTRGKQHYDYTGKKYGQMPNDWKDLQPISVYHPCVNGMEDTKTKQYPLMLLSPQSRFRIHYMLQDVASARECYRHGVIISAADAKARGIKDGDIVRIWNDQGQSARPAYVTNRLMPGIVQMRTGIEFNFTRSGLDTGGCVNIFTGGDDISPVTPAKITNLVDVERYLPGDDF